MLSGCSQFYHVIGTIRLNISMSNSHHTFKFNGICEKIAATISTFLKAYIHEDNFCFIISSWHRHWVSTRRWWPLVSIGPTSWINLITAAVRIWPSANQSRELNQTQVKSLRSSYGLASFQLIRWSLWVSRKKTWSVCQSLSMLPTLQIGLIKLVISSIASSILSTWSIAQIHSTEFTRRSCMIKIYWFGLFWKSIAVQFIALYRVHQTRLQASSSCNGRFMLMNRRGSP